MFSAQNRNRTTQRGSALIVALVFLIILTILGISTMSTSRLELKMAANTQFAKNAFQAAESGIELTLEENDIRDTSRTSSNPVPHAYTLGGDTAATSTSFITSGTVPTGGFSLGSAFKAYHFEIQSTGASAAGGESRHTQGFYIVGPG